MRSTEEYGTPAVCLSAMTCNRKRGETGVEVRQFRLDQKGLLRFFGPLEARIMEVIWQQEPCTIRQVHEELQQEQAISFNAVMTVMNRLVAKGHLNRRKEGRTHVYRPAMEKERFIEAQSKTITQQLVGEFGELVVSQMVDALKAVDPDLLQKLAEHLRRVQSG